MPLDGVEAFALLAAGAVAGAAIERYRNARREQPLTLGATPHAWARGVRESIGLWYSLIGGLAAVSALAVLLMPALSGTGEPDTRAAVSARVAGVKISLPAVNVLTRAPGTPFTARGVSFRVSALRAIPASLGPLQRPAGRRLRWMLVGIDSRNLSRPRFRPSAVAYRLEDERGRSYWPDIGGGAGPASLGQTGFLGRGELFRTRLSFRVSRASRRLTLVFEPVPDGSVQVEVPLGRRLD
jgi:hypothetical protein